MMRSRTALLVWTILSHGVLAQTPAVLLPDQAPPVLRGGGRIMGRVVAADTGNPLARARVQITSPALPKQRQITTDASGRYEAAGLSAGRYKILVTRAGFVALEYGQTRPFQSGRELELLDGQTLDEIDFQLSRGGVIAGRITDHTGEPQPGIPVTAQRLSWSPAGIRHLERNPSAFFDRILTDDLGHFRIYGLSPGSYVVAAGSVPGMIGMPESAAPGVTYFPGTANAAEAQSVDVELGQEVAAHFVLAAPQLARISGTIVDSGGRPVVWRSVMLASRMDGSVAMRTAATTRPDGTFEITAVPPGNYTIEVSPLRTQTDDREFASFAISVDGHDISDVMISMKAGATVSGRVIWEGRAPPPAAPMRITPAAAVPGISVATPASGGGTVDAQGRFSIVGLHGPVVFYPSFDGRDGRAEPWTMKAVRIGAADITDIAYDVSSDIDGLEVIMTDRETRISGIVRGERNQPAMDYVVVVVPAITRPGVNPTRFIQTARPDQQGRYQFRGLPPGQYVAAAVESLSRDGHYDPAFQKQVRDRGTQFILKDAQQLALDLMLLN